MKMASAWLVIAVIVAIAAIVVVGAGVAALVYFQTRDKSKRPDDDD
jgi:hypothetical protein